MSALEKAARAAYGIFAAEEFPEVDAEEYWVITDRSVFTDVARAVLMAVRDFAHDADCKPDVFGFDTVEGHVVDYLSTLLNEELK